MRSSRLIPAVAIVGFAVLSTSASALEPDSSHSRAVHPTNGPKAPGAAPNPPTISNTCPATNVGVLSDGSTIVGSTIGATDDFVAGCGSQVGDQDQIFEFSVDPCGTWAFDTCTVPACWDTTLEIREETGGGCPGDFVACDGDSCGVCYYESAVSAFLGVGTTYYLIVDGWRTFAYGDFTITATLSVPCCTSDADCDDGVFCNGAEICDTASGECQPGDKACATYEGYSAPCDEDTDSCPVLDPCFTWIAGGDSGFFFPGSAFCPDLASWLLDDVQGSHHTSGFLDIYTTPIFARSTPTGASPLGTTFLVNQALFTVESGTCFPAAQIPGSQCTGAATVDPAFSPAHELPCSGTMPLLPNNSGDFNVCEIDLFMAYRTVENGAGMGIAGQKPRLGGPAGADDFGMSVIWIEDCPPTGVFFATFFGDDAELPADIATAVVCQKPEVQCCQADGSCSIGTADDCTAAGGSVVCTGTIDGGRCACDDDADRDGIDDLCDNCLNDFNPSQEDCDGDGEGDACEIDPCEQDDDGDGVCNCVDNCPTVPNPDQADRDGDGVGDACDGCPDDPEKFDPGLCGCDVPDDVDSDGDGVQDCIDLCPGVDDAVFAPECKGAIPTISQWGLIVLTLLFLAGGKILFGIRRLVRS